MNLCMMNIKESTKERKIYNVCRFKRLSFRTTTIKSRIF